jgi:cephalosporin hydroxylase
MNIRGFCNFTDIYDHLINEASDGAKFVEVGALFGASSVYMAQRIKESGKKIEFHVVDVWDARGIDGSLLGKDDFDYFRYAGIPEVNLDKNPDILYYAFLKGVFVNGVTQYIFPVKLPSVFASTLYKDKSLDFVFIDADHKYEGVLADITAWLPKIRDGGIIAGHDYDWDGVKKAVNEVFTDKVISIGTSWMIQL